MENLRAAVAEHPGEFPLLEKTLVSAEKAYSVKAEWLVDVLVDGSTAKKIVLHNYLEIFRASSKREVLSKIERALARQSPPTIDYDAPNPHGEMAGIPFYNLGLRSEHANRGRLRVLRDLFELEPGDWIAEVTVQA